MSSTEDMHLDRALTICRQMENDLEDCLSTVNRLNRKYNAPGRYTTDMKPFDVDTSLDSSSYKKSDDLNISSLSLSNISTINDETVSIDDTLEQGRSAQELNETYTDLKYKSIKLKRELEATVAHAQHVAECGESQKKVKHLVVKNLKKKEMMTCKH